MLKGEGREERETNFYEEEDIPQINHYEEDYHRWNATPAAAVAFGVGACQVKNNIYSYWELLIPMQSLSERTLTTQNQLLIIGVHLEIDHNMKERSIVTERAAAVCSEIRIGTVFELIL